MKRFAIVMIMWIPRLMPFFMWLHEQRHGSKKKGTQRRRRKPSSTNNTIYEFLWDMVVLFNTEREIRAAGWVRPEDTTPFWRATEHQREHPIFDIEKWRYAVFNDLTRQSYEAWVNHQLAEEELCRK